MRTFADNLKKARAQAQSAGMQVMAAGVLAGDVEPAPDPVAETLADLERRIVPAQSAGAVADNPRVRCDYCPRVQQADMMVEIEPGRYACDACLWLGKFMAR